MLSDSSFELKSHCFSSFQRFQCVNSWTISSFRLSCNNLDSGGYRTLASSPFTVDLDGKISSALSIVKAHPSRCPEAFRLKLKLESNDEACKSRIPAYYTFVFKRANGEKCYDYASSRCMSTGQEESLLTFEMEKFEKYGGKTNYLENDEDLTVTCGLLVCGDGVNWSYCLPAKPIKRSPQIELDFVKLLDSGEFSDITIEANGVSFKALKAILAARSEYFRAMFIHDTIEASTSHVKMSDIEPKVVRAILRYLYSGNIDLEAGEELKGKVGQPHLDGENNKSDGNIGADNCQTKTQDFYHENWFVIDLLKAADKCQLDDLKENCEHALGAKISVESAVDLLELAHIYRASNLKYSVIQFMIVHAKELYGTIRLRELTKENPELSTDLFEGLFKALATGRDIPTTTVKSKSDTLYLD